MHVLCQGGRDAGGGRGWEQLREWIERKRCGKLPADAFSSLWACKREGVERVNERERGRRASEESGCPLNCANLPLEVM